MKPASEYDYSKDEIPGKQADDWDYIKNGEDGNMFTRWVKTIKRDWNAKGNEQVVQDIDDLVTVAQAIPMIRIGKFTVEREVFHRTIKSNILKEARKVGSYEKMVGKNPDILIENSQIIFRGTGPFKGKTYNTGLNANDFFK